MDIILNEQLSNRKYIFSEWTKIDIENFLLSDEITIENKINIFGDFLNWKNNCIFSNTNNNYPDMYPFINLFLTYVYIKEKLIVQDVKDYLCCEFNFKSTIDNLTNKQILSGLVLYSFMNKIYKEI